MSYSDSQLENRLSGFVRGAIIFIAAFLFCNALVYLFALRLIDVNNVWPAEAVTYARWMGYYYASFVIIMVCILLIVQKNIYHFKKLIFVSGIFAFFHGLLLLYASVSENFDSVYNSHPSLMVWMPSYDSFLLLEAVIAIVYAALILLWKRSHSRKSL